MESLSSTNRESNIQQLKNRHFDLLVIGGGITGAGIALDAASRGMKVALLEKQDFASGTSSKSTKLIHGGLRYLKQFEIGLVREVGKERAIVHRLAPHLVRSEKMLLPLIKGGTYGGFATSIGLMVYDLLAGVKGTDKRVMLDKQQTLNKEPLLQSQADILKGGGYYAEYRTDDARLTIENIKAAAEFGAICLNYIKVEGFMYENGQVSGVKCTDIDTAEGFEVKTSHIISAAGPWVDRLRKKDESLKGKRLFLSKGVHIVVPHERFPLRQSVYFDVPDGRMMFAIPRNRSTYIGTTDTEYNGSLNDIPIFRQDIKYILDSTNSMFPDLDLKEEDIESSWAGLRPLIHEEGKSASEMSRKDEIFESDTGLISIAGGKLTGYRKMAERVVDLVSKRFEDQQRKALKDCRTDKLPLAGGAFKTGAEVRTYEQQISQQIAAMGLPPYYAQYLVANYGKQTETILGNMKSYNEDAEPALAKAECWYCINHELALHPLDYLNRRSGRLYFNLPSIETILPAVIATFQQYLHWEDAKAKQVQQEVKQVVYDASHFEAKVEVAAE